MARKLPINITREQLNKIFTLVLAGNSVLAIFSVVAFFLSSWWIFLIIGTLGFPFILAGAYAYRNTRYREPMKRYAIKYIVGIYNRFVEARASLLRRIYTIVCWAFPDEGFKQLSWGYAPLTNHGQLLSNLEGIEAEKRYYTQLYHYLATGMGNWSTLEGKSVLEIGSGGGAGIKYISKHLNPTSAAGVDLSATQAKYNEENSEESALSFYTAEKPESFYSTSGLRRQFDLVLQLQGSQFITDFKKFMQEVDSATKPGGIFAFADLRSLDGWINLEEELQSLSLNILKKENISKNVEYALKLDQVEKFQVLNKRFGSFLRSIFHKVGVVKDNVIANTLRNGSAEARVYLLHKPSQQFVGAY